VIEVVLAEDQYLVREGLRLMIDAQPDMRVVGEASDGRAAVDETLVRRPDVVVMDVRMPQLDGIEATRQIVERSRHPVRVLVLTTFDLDEYVVRGMRAGASGFLLKSVAPQQLADGIRTVAAGDAMLAPTVTRRLLDEFVRRPRPETDANRVLAELTDRERHVLRMLALGLSNAEIADRLVVTPATVKTHVTRILSKLDLRDRVQAVVLAYETGLVQPGEHGAPTATTRG
jgi:DNA-binding NarL/FixJ family response regulator